MYFLSILFTLGIVSSFLIQTQGADKYTDGNRPYEFGFNIEGEQHRQEKKDEKGLIMGEFGFITADGVYHVTVYATDEQGRFKIVSMKNIRVKPYPTYKRPEGGSARQGHSLDVNTPRNTIPNVPTQTLEVPVKRISIEPPAKSCSSCSLPTTTQAPASAFIQPSYGQNPASVNPQYPQDVSNQVGFNGQNDGQAPVFPANQQNNRVQTTSQQGPGSSLDAPGRGFVSTNQNLPNSYPSPQQGNQPLVPTNQLSPNAYPSVQQGNQPLVPTNQLSPKSYPSPQQSNQPLVPTNQLSPNFYPSPQQGNQPPVPTNQFSPSSYPSAPQGNQPPVTQNQFSPSYPSLPQDNQPQGIGRDGTRTAKKYDGQPQQPFGKAGTQPNSIPNRGGIQGQALPNKPTLISAQMQIVDKNTDIYRKSPGEQEGLPDGLTTGDMTQLLYTFNYTVGFHGHFEEGYRNGAKQGYYFITGRNGVRTRVDYVADDKGFRPKITQEVLDLLSEDVPKPETEKNEKYGLKGYEFKWLYFPVDSKGH